MGKEVVFVEMERGSKLEHQERTPSISPASAPSTSLTWPRDREFKVTIFWWFQRSDEIAQKKGNYVTLKKKG